MSFQICMHLFLLLNSKEDILKNVANQTVFVPIDFTCSYWDWTHLVINFLQNIWRICVIIHSHKGEKITGDCFPLTNTRPNFCLSYTCISVHIQPPTVPWGKPEVQHKHSRLKAPEQSSQYMFNLSETWAFWKRENRTHPESNIYREHTSKTIMKWKGLWESGIFCGEITRDGCFWSTKKHKSFKRPW